jgi:membrane-associated phospholipid phosphatase
LRRFIWVVFVALLLPRAAQADDSGASPEMRPSYAWDGGAIPFFWGALAARLAIDHYLQPPETPRLFDAEEGGKAVASWELPGWGVTAAGAAAGLAMVLSGDSSRSYHVKGLAESLATGCLVTAALKVTFGRHRPDYPNGTEFGGESRSFPSGHATQAFAIATYAALFLHGHVFGGGFGWREALADGAIFGAAALLAGERVYHHRHHLEDVAVGALLGSASSVGFYLYQEHRFKHRDQAEARRVMVTPTGTGVQLGWTF